MTELRELYRCQVCGNVVEIVNEGQPALVCCNQPMGKLDIKTEDAGQEKHVPIIEDADCGIKVKVGAVAHPMEEEHYIKCIEVLTEDKVFRAELLPGQPPEAEFFVKRDQVVAAREFCTVHGLWKN